MSNNVDLNTASMQDIERIQGIGKDFAKRIVDYRTQNGPFKNWEDVKRVSGINTVMLDTLKRNGFTVGGRAA